MTTPAERSSAWTNRIPDQTPDFPGKPSRTSVALFACHSHCIVLRATCFLAPFCVPLCFLAPFCVSLRFLAPFCVPLLFLAPFRMPLCFFRTVLRAASFSRTVSRASLVSCTICVSTSFLASFHGHASFLAPLCVFYVVSLACRPHCLFSPLFCFIARICI